MNKFYTYLHCKPNGEPFYVGKGFGKRCNQFSIRNYHHKNIVAKYGRENIGVFVFPCESERQALMDEIQQIAMLRKAGYKLCNQTDGGEGSSGKIVSIETRKKIGLANSGKKRTDEHREKISKAMIGNQYNKGKKLTISHKENISIKLRGCNNPMHGKARTDDEKRKISIALTGRKATEETKVKLSIARKGKPPNKGKIHSVEAKLKMSLAAKGRVKSEETRKKLSSSLTGRKLSEETKLKMAESARNRGKKKQA